MKLIYSPASPFVRKVSVLIIEAGLEKRITQMPVKTTALAPDNNIAEHNPLMKIPALLRDDTPALYDSRVICRYLNDLSGGRFYPEDKLWDCLVVEAAADGIMESAVAMVYERKLRPEKMQFEPWIEAQWSKVETTLSALESHWIGYFKGPYDMAQIATACALGYLDFRHADRSWKKNAPQLAEWYDAISARPAFQATWPRDH